jgi:hypothetical protein
MKKLVQINSIFTALLLTGCVSGLPNLLESNLEQNNQKMVTFQTNQVHFMYSLKSTSTLSERNDYLDEFILKSDMQCQNYLNNPLKKPEVDNSKDSLYMSMFDTVSSLFGISLATNAAKAVFLEKDSESIEEKKAYVNALTPEIRKGVEIGRSRFAKAMTNKKNLNLKAYSINNLREDTLKYDKQCDDAYGLIEINRALKEMQSAVYTRTTPSVPTLNIDPKAIKAKVEAASKEVEEKKIEKSIKSKAEVNATKVISTQPKLENVPVRHDSVQHLPRSIQI